ncbi:hypothetical protein GCM10007385_02560 [Tateyamaria omphalii]|uniref:hypothetical protein n=1 Tax=Tateyamaria omphalii TaxID=299262 RepID=UPI001673434E|nr:hypothetical protein [Tateyamaria omphalii]GGX39102.1 hypothetical protein GCM10007385_02560 [Tateyamaria omphalii]
MHAIKIFLFDDQQDELDSAEEAFRNLFEARGETVDVQPRLIEGWEEKDIKEIRKYRPEIIVFDNSFGSGSTRGMFGQERISELKIEFPDSVFILLTKLNISGPSLRSQFPQADIFIEKRGFSQSDGPYREWVYGEISKFLTRARVDQIDVSGSRKALERLQVPDVYKKRRAPSEWEIRSLIEQVCYTGGLPSENVVNGVRLTRLIGGKSGAAVSLMYLKTEFSEYKVPAVLKIMGSKDAILEARHHAKFAKWVLPYRWRVDLIGTGQTDTFGAVCYSFAHGGSGDPLTLNSLISKGEVERERVKRVFAQVFDSDSQAWYSQQEIQNKPLASYFLENPPYFTEQSNETARRETVEEILEEVSNFDGCVPIGRFDDGRLEVAGFSVQMGDMLTRVLQIDDVNETRLCLSHGDLNGGNILVAEGSSEFSFIDFRHTGYHHIARDFCSLEGSIRTLQPIEETGDDFSELFSLEIDRWKRFRHFSRSHLSFAGDDLVDLLRQYYLLNHENGSKREYAMASFLHTLWLLSFHARDPKAWSPAQLIRLKAFLLATGHVLDACDLPA